MMLVAMVDCQAIQGAQLGLERNLLMILIQQDQETRSGNRSYPSKNPNSK
jgi:hypothetical protein